MQVADDDSDKLAVRVHIGRNPFQLFISDVTAHLRDDVVTLFAADTNMLFRADS